MMIQDNKVLADFGSPCSLSTTNVKYKNQRPYGVYSENSFGIRSYFLILAFPSCLTLDKWLNFELQVLSSVKWGGETNFRVVRIKVCEMPIT